MVGVEVTVGVLVGVRVRVGVLVGGVPVTVGEPAAGVDVGGMICDVEVGIGVNVEVTVGVAVLVGGTGVLVGVKVGTGVHGARQSSDGWSPLFRIVRAEVILTVMPSGVHLSMRGVMK
jgi:hypothetical protein